MGSQGAAAGKILFRFMLAVLATWRVTHLLAQEDGPWDLIARVRERAGGGFWGKLMDCFKCLSLWVAAPFSFFISGARSETLLSWLALSGAAILIQEHLQKPFVIEEDQNHELLWSETES
jgi:hypothetical protein